MHFDVAIVGAGVIGLSIARSVAKLGANVVVLEEKPEIGQGISSRNSGVIHAGIYYGQGSFKRKFCVEGRDQLYRYAAARNIPHKKLGKFIVANNNEEKKYLARLKRLNFGQKNIRLDWADPSIVAEQNDGVKCTAALYSPDSGIIDQVSLIRALEGELSSLGAIISLNFHSV